MLFLFSLPAHGFRSFLYGVPFAHSGTFEEAEEAGNAQRWLLCLMLSEGLITSEQSDKAVSFVSEFNDQLFNQYTEEYGRMRSDAYYLAWISATVATNEYNSRCEKI